MEQRGESQKIISSVSWNFLGQGWLLLVAFVCTPFIVNRLNVTLYGIYTLSGVIVAYLSFLELGLGAAATKHMAQYLAGNDEEGVRSVFWSCALAYAAMGAAGFALVFAATPLLVHRFLNIGPELRDTAFTVLRLGAAGLLLGLINNATTNAFRALGRFDILNRLGIALGTLQTLGTVLMLALGRSLPSIMVLQLCVQLSGIAYAAYRARRLLPCIARFSLRRSVLGQLASYGGFMTASGLLAPVLANAEKFFLTAFYPISSLTYYSIPASLVSKMGVIPSSFSTVVFPAFSRFHAADQKEMNRELLMRSTLYPLYPFAFFTLFFIFWGKPFLALWIGENFAEHSPKILTLLAAAGLVNALAYPSLALIQGTGRPQLQTLFYAVETLAYLPVGYFLIRHYAAAGAALAWLLRICLDTVLMQKAACGIAGMRLRSWYREIARRTALPVLACALLFGALRASGLPLLSPLTLSGLCATGGAYFFIVWRWSLDPLGRARITEFVRGFAGRGYPGQETNAAG